MMSPHWLSKLDYFRCRCKVLRATCRQLDIMASAPLRAEPGKLHRIMTGSQWNSRMCNA